MKKFRILSMIPATALIIAGACSQDVLQPDDNGSKLPDIAEGDGVYMNVNIKMPGSGSTRSYTDTINSSSGGTEVGKDYENNISNVFLVLAKSTPDRPATDNNFIAWGEISGSDVIKSTDGTQYTSTATISKSQLKKYYESLDTADKSREVNVYVFCNPTLSLRKLLESNGTAETKTNDWVNAVGEFDAHNNTADVIWSENSFLMSNSIVSTRTLPQTIEQWDAYTEQTNPFKLSGTNEDGSDNLNNNRGSIPVERTAARLDFKDASPEFDGKKGNNLYQVVFQDDSIGGHKFCYVNVKLNKMSLTNMNKKYYYLRRVSNNGLPSNATLLGPELPWFAYINGGLVNLADSGNYIVNPIAQEMMGPITSGFSTYFNYPFFNSKGEIDEPTLTDWYTSETDNVVGDNPKEYHIWRYVTENTIPGILPQKNGQSTGIIFKGKMIATEEAEESDDPNIRELAKYLNNKDGVLTGSSDKDPIIYRFRSVKNNIGGMFAKWENVQEAAKKAAIVPVWEADNTPAGGYWRLEINRSNSLFNAVFGSGSCGSYTFVTATTNDTVTVMDPLVVTDDKGNPVLVDGKEQPKWDENSPNYKWEKWNAAGKPVPGTDIATEANLELYYDFKKTAVDHDITLYQSSYDGGEEHGYYCYYYYWNRHNDNGMNGIMGPMEFATVRNNVYKIAVTAINDIGHPRISTNDPKKPTPNTDDEIDDVYISVNVNVLPWVVRFNNVEF